MRILFFDIDTLRYDHLGCYGYGRGTSPNIDAIAGEGAVFRDYYCSNAPCLPSRAALTTGRHGIRNGVVGHGGTAADLRITGRGRDFRDAGLENSLFNIFRKAGFYTSSISTFAERHSAFWFLSGLNEYHNCGGGGNESAEQVVPIADDWLGKNGAKDSWMLHVHLWDPHTPYRAPEEFGNPFADAPLPAWLTDEIFASHQNRVGPHSPKDMWAYWDHDDPRYPRYPGSVTDKDRLRMVFDGYDCGVAWADRAVGHITGRLKEMGVYDDTAIIITTDHGENLGELGIYGEHGTADECTTHIPMIIKWPGIAPKYIDGLYSSVDLLPTLADFLGVEKYPGWDGISYHCALTGCGNTPRDFLVTSQCAHVCQLGLRWRQWMYIRTYHGGLHLFNDEMLFDVESDPHELRDLAAALPEEASACRELLEGWRMEMCGGDISRDPMMTVLGEGGPYHTRGYPEYYAARLAETGRAHAVDELLRRYPPRENSL